MSLWGCDCPLLALAACHQRGMVCSWLSLFSPLLCVRAWRCLRLGLAFRVVIIPQSGLLAQVSLLWLHWGHSGPILKKHCHPHLPAQAPACQWQMQASALLLHWGSYRWARNLLLLIIYLFFFPVMLPSVLPRLATDSAARVFPGFGNFSLFKTPFPGQSSLPTSFVSFFVFYIFSYLFLKTLSCFSGCLMSSAGIQRLFCGIYSAFKCSFDEFVGGKVVSSSCSSAILGPPPELSTNKF